LSYRAFQKRFGRSISVRAPKLFLTILTRKAESAGGQVIEFNPRTTALSQTCVCGQKHKKRLSERVHDCSCGVTMQRDLFSAYLARFVEHDALQVPKASESWAGGEPLLRTAWKRATEKQPASRRSSVSPPRPTSFGRYSRGPSQSGSSAEVCATVGIVENRVTEISDGVAVSQEVVRAEKRLPEFADRTPRL